MRTNLKPLFPRTHVSQHSTHRVAVNSQHFVPAASPSWCSSPALTWGLSQGRLSFPASSNMGYSLGLHFFTNCSSFGPFPRGAVLQFLGRCFLLWDKMKKKYKESFHQNRTDQWSTWLCLSCFCSVAGKKQGAWRNVSNFRNTEV